MRLIDADWMLALMHRIDKTRAEAGLLTIFDSLYDVVEAKAITGEWQPFDDNVETNTIGIIYDSDPRAHGTDKYSIGYIDTSGTVWSLNRDECPLNNAKYWHPLPDLGRYSEDEMA